MIEGREMILILVVLAFLGSEATAEESGMYDPDLYEGDLILTTEQKSAILHGVSGRASIRTRLWPNGVLPYTIDATLARNPRGMAAIRAGMRLWTATTCIRFKRRTNERNYAHFYIGRGCSSYVGQKGGRQYISLAPGCWAPHIVSHEIGHCLGFFHEQSRPDRDNYVQIIWQNIPSGVRFNFNKLSSSQVNSLGTPYDYASLMHYERTAFGSGRETIRPRRAGVTLGNKRGPTAIDIRQMKLLYKCSGGGGGGGGGVCVDKDRRCPLWTKHCRTNAWMKANCKKTCRLCGGGGGVKPCRDRDNRCRQWTGYCRSNNYVKQNCKRTCRLC